MILIIFIDFLKQDFEKLGINVTAHKGVLELSGKAPRSAIISAHIDRHGLISMGEGHYGYAAEYIKENKYDVALTINHSTFVLLLIDKLLKIRQ